MNARIRRSGCARDQQRLALSTGRARAARASARPRAPRPTTPPATDSTRLSTSSCRTSRPRDAPSDSRTAISFCRMKRARDQQVRDVGAGDQQHQADHAHQHDQRRREIVAQAASSPSAAGSTSSCPFMNCSREYVRPVLRRRQRHLVRADLREQPLQRRLRRFDGVARLQPREHLHPARARGRPCAPSPTRAPSPASSGSARGSAATAPDRGRQSPAADTPTIVIG